MRRLLLTALLTGVLVGLLGLAAGPAAAHGDLVDGSPGPGDTVAPRTSVLRLDLSDLDPDAPTAVALSDEDGAPLAVGEPTVVGDTLCARSASLTPGVVTLEYAGVATDGHRVGGRYAFEVGGGGTAAEPGVCAEADLAAPPREARTLAEMTGTDGGVPAWVIAGLVVLALLAAAGVVLRVRSDRRADPEPETSPGSRPDDT